MMADSLLTHVDGLLARAGGVLPGADEQAEIEAARRRLHEPLRVAIAGRVKAGKSTLLNALVGEGLAPTDASECTRIVTWYRNGLTYEVFAHLRSGAVAPAPFRREAGAVTVELGEIEPADVERLEVHWPSRRLETMTLIDTPGLDSVSTDVSERTMTFLETDGHERSVADAIVYLMRHVHPGDVRLMEAFQDDEFGRGSAVNAIGVLSRADEVGGCRPDAMDVAARAAERYRATPSLRGVCLTVLPVAGLVAQVAATLTEAQFMALAAIARRPPKDLAEMLVTVDRFRAHDDGCEVDVPTRYDLLERFGLYGVRVGIDAIRRGRVTTSRQLADELLAKSGLDALQDLLATHFAGRSRVLKARTALLALDAMLHPHSGTAAVEEIQRDAERLQAGAHEFAEMRLITALRAGLIELDDERAADLERVLGGAGPDPVTRLGLGPDATTSDIAAAAATELARWRRLADHPMTSRAVSEAAHAAVRSCEGLLVQLTPGDGVRSSG